MNDPQFPDGKIRADDQGVTDIAIGVRAGRVVMLFREPVTWLGFDYETAIALADSIRDRAEALKDTGN